MSKFNEKKKTIFLYKMYKIIEFVMKIYKRYKYFIHKVENYKQSLEIYIHNCINETFVIIMWHPKLGKT